MPKKAVLLQVKIPESTIEQRGGEGWSRSCFENYLFFIYLVLRIGTRA